MLLCSIPKLAVEKVEFEHTNPLMGKVKHIWTEGERGRKCVAIKGACMWRSIHYFISN